MATLFSVATSCVYFLLSPVNEGHSELLARTSPTIYDVMIGFFGGAAERHTLSDGLFGFFLRYQKCVEVEKVTYFISYCV